MGWNTSALFVRDRTLHQVLRFLPDIYNYEPTGEIVPAAGAIGSTPSAWATGRRSGIPTAG